MDKQKVIIAGIVLLLLLSRISKANNTQNYNGKQFSFINNKQVIRNDTMGKGHYGARRKDKDGNIRQHKGVDIIVNKGDAIIAPFDCTLIRIAKPYYPKHPHIHGFLIERADGFRFKVFYCTLVPNAIGKSFKKGETLAYAQAISSIYGKAMLDHIHIEAYVNGSRVDATPFLNIEQ